MSGNKSNVSKGGKITVTVTVVPTSGRPVKKTVDVEASGASLREVLMAADVSPEKRDLYIDGEPATLDTHVVTGQGVSTRKKAPPPEVRVAERPAGS